MIEENVLGNKVKNLRLKMKLTQEQFAKKMGMTRNTYKDIETGRNKCTNLDVITKLSEVTGQPVSYFLDEKIEIDLGIYEVMDKSFDKMLDMGLIDDKGEFDPMFNDMMLDLLKKTLALKKERLNK